MPSFSGPAIGAAAIGATGAIGSSLINSSNSPSGTTTTTGTSAPWTGMQPDLLKALNAAGNLYSKNPEGPSYFPQDTYAGLDTTEYTALGSLTNTGLNGTSALDASIGGNSDVGSGALLQPAQTTDYYANQSLKNLLSPSTADPSTNPYLQQAEQNTVAATLPAIQAQAAAGGRADSGEANFAQSQGLASALGNLNYGQYNTGVGQELTAADQAGTNYNAGVTAMNQAALAAPGLNTATLQGQEEAYNAGQSEQQNTQNQLDADISRYNYGQEQPYNAISLLEGETTGSGGTTSQSTPYYSNGLANALSGGTSALGLYNALGGSSLFGGSGGWGSSTGNDWDTSDSFANGVTTDGSGLTAEELAEFAS